jgi:hypothetical protein
MTILLHAGVSMVVSTGTEPHQNGERAECIRQWLDRLPGRAAGGT